MKARQSLLIIAAAALGCLILLIVFSGLQDGGEIFRKEGCIGCHSFRGSGGSIGPDLTAVRQRRSASWIRAQIKDPKSHNPATLMPSYSHLSYLEITALIRYLRS